MIRQLSCAALLAGALGLAGCSDDPVCVAPDLACAPLYPPSFDNVFANTLQPRCAVAGVACHAREGAAGGLVFEDIDEAYAQLTNATAGRIDADAPGCGAFAQRLHSSDPSFQMPPSAPLSEAELCAIDQWLFMGAPR